MPNNAALMANLLARRRKKSNIPPMTPQQGFALVLATAIIMILMWHFVTSSSEARVQTAIEDSFQKQAQPALVKYCNGLGLQHDCDAYASDNLKKLKGTLGNSYSAALYMIGSCYQRDSSPTVYTNDYNDCMKQALQLILQLNQPAK